MPGRDGTGPAGEGPRTGWKMGMCPPTQTEKEMAETQPQQDSSVAPQMGLGRGLGRFAGRGMGFGRGRGAGCRRGRGGNRW